MAIDYVGKKCIMTNEGQWNNQRTYEPLCFVTDTAGNSFCSKIDVPAGTPLSNTTYWIPQGSMSGEIEYAKQLATQASQDATEALTQVTDKVSKTDVVSTAEDLQAVVTEGKLADAVLMKKAYKDADDSITAIGTMTDLQTTEKTTLVGAINEAYNRQPDVLATKEEVEANTQEGMIADALVTKELSTEIAQLNQSLAVNTQSIGEINDALSGHSIVASGYVQLGGKSIVAGQQQDLTFSDNSIKSTDIPLVTKYVAGAGGGIISERTFVNNGNVSINIYPNQSNSNVYIGFWIVVLRKRS